MPTDGRHTYFRNPVAGGDELHAYTAMPTSFHGFMPREELAQAEMGRFLGHTYNIPVYKIPQTGKPPHHHTATGAYVPRQNCLIWRPTPPRIIRWVTPSARAISAIYSAPISTVSTRRRGICERLGL